jgi:cytochrome b561
LSSTASKPGNVAQPVFNDTHSLAIRIWHWIFAVLIFATITCVGLASFTFSTGTNIPLVQKQLQQKGVIVDAKAAGAVSHAFNDKLWELHTFLGYIIAAFVLGRFLLEIGQPNEEKFVRRMRSALWPAMATVEGRRERKHYRAVKWSYIVFYVLIGVMAITGIGLALEDVPFFQAIRRPIKTVHNFTQYGIYGFILVHLVGVIAADAGRYPGMVSGMIHGRSRAGK